MMSEAVYEEIQHRHNHFTQRGSLISEELHSGYEDADELLSEEMKQITPGYYDDFITDGLKPDRETEGDQEEYDDVKNSNEDERNLLGSLISEELHSGYEDADELLSAKEFKTAYYDDVTSNSGLKEEMVKEITPGYYDDVITDGLEQDRETEETPESYDDVMTSGHSTDIKKVDTPENYDDVIINRPSSHGVTEGVQEEYDDVMSVSEDVRNLLDYDDVEEESNKEVGHLTQ
ncbi:uncharacterized protein LOC109069083 [Cyprinus carpio]|uniref:Uncharacterized protein LOC109069083 n=1 Tax=Cyprinus carpio TaxID=7962 RepID=A0A9R0ABX9_CYPCA|nr:uncharacterized protein LOC109069083 [Cyprinus carpio]